MKEAYGQSESDVLKESEKSEKKASVAKRAAAGAIIAGETGTIIGAASAINANLKDKK